MFNSAKQEQLRALLHQSPRNFGKAWIVSPDEQYALKKHQRNRLICLSEQYPNWALDLHTN
ncbi:hypothetical protein [Phormidesmis priestleyi]|nr:hypothetical protein [Phormidesmis priestleyi]